MKSKIFKLTSVLLCICLMFSVFSPAVSAKTTEENSSQKVSLSDETMEKVGNTLSDFLNFIINDVLLGTLAKVLPNFSFVRDASSQDVFDAFYEGNEEFISQYSDKYIWRVGYAQRSIIPNDFGKKFKYARGSYAPWGYSSEIYTDDEGKPEDLKVRTVVIDDCTGRGLTVMAVVDCIGISNTDVMIIREALSDFAKEHNVVSLNISATHSHMSIDSQGVWNAPISTGLNNAVSGFTGLTQTKSGVNKDYFETIIERTKESVIEAYDDMKDGKLTYTNIELDDYFRTRTVSPELDNSIHKLMFTPLDGSKPTLMASFGAHPEISSYGAENDTRLSADFVYYMEKLINSAGANFIFIQGNVGTNSVQRYHANDNLDLKDNHESAIRVGYEFGYICLGASMNYDERKALNDKLGDKLDINTLDGNEGYTAWYKDLPVFEERDVEAVLNVKHRQVKLELDNSVSLILIKLGLASNYISYDKATHKYYSVTEIGYMEFGSALKAFLSPGELYSELLVGGYGLRNSDYKSLRESFGENVILFDLMNDAVGYVCPDETYSVVGFKYNPVTKKLEGDTWCMAVSIGKNTASQLMKAYNELVTSVK